MQNNLSLDFIEDRLVIKSLVALDRVRISRNSVKTDFFFLDKVVVIDLQDFNPLKDDIYVIDNEEEVSINYLFDEFNELIEENSKQFNNTFVHSKKRKLTGSKLLYTCLNHLEIYKSSNAQLCLISIASYRVSENLANNSHNVKYLLDKYKSALLNIDYYDPLVFRWFVSASAPLSICLIENGMFDCAREVLDNVVSHSYISNLSPLTYWNIIVIYHLLAMIKFHAGDINAAAALFLISFNFSQNAYNVLHNSSNEWVFSQYHDLFAFQKLSKNGLAAAYILYEGKFPTETKFKQPKVIDVPKADVNILLQRYPAILEVKKSVIRKLFYNLNRYKK